MKSNAQAVASGISLRRLSRLPKLEFARESLLARAVSSRIPSWAKRSAVAFLAIACEMVDAALYRPRCRWVRAVARLWYCRLARLSARLDDHWAAGYWDQALVPHGCCGICTYRPALFELGHNLDRGSPFMVCGWCETALDWSNFDAALAEARLRSL
jgi:hypothetical protein